jgi:predicted ATPase/DNA-binding CsgD family transcriptional regulator
MVLAPARQVGNLPAELTSFVGRRREVARARSLLGGSRLVTITGVGGVGKTRLALRTAAEAQRAFRHGVWLVDLASLTDPGLVAQAVGSALGLRYQSTRWPLSILSDYLADRQTLLVLDNCEHLLDACAVLVDVLLRAAADLRILATSRQPLGTDGEQIMQLPTLSVPDPEHLPPVEAMAQYEAVTLFAERAAAVRRDFALTEDNRKPVVLVCCRLDGIPLAVELAARRLRSLSVEQLLDRLADRYRLLTTDNRAALPRQQTLRALIDWSFDLCSPPEQVLWQRVSVFAGAFDVDMAEGVCGGDCLPRANTLDMLTALVDKSILIAQEAGGRMRYRMLETIRQYGRDRLAAAGQEAAVRQRHLDWYQNLAAQAGPDLSGPRQMQWFGRLQLEHAELRAALEFSFTEPARAEAGLRIAGSLWVYWGACGLVAEGRRWLDAGLRLHTDPCPVRAQALWAASWVTSFAGDTAQSVRLGNESRLLAEDLGDTANLADALRVCGLNAIVAGDPAEATALLEEALRRHRDLGNQIGVRYDLAHLALVATMLGERDRAIALYEECIAIGEAHQERWLTSYNTYGLGTERWRQGETERPTALIQDSLRAKAAFNDRIGISVCIEGLAWIAATRGSHERAALLLGAAQAVALGAGESLFGLAHLIADHDRCQARTRRALGERGFQAAFDRGALLSLDAAVAEALQETRRTPAGDHTRPGAAPILTRREAEVAGLVARGLSNKDIAATLVISHRTADAHVQHILVKLGFTARTQIAAWLAEHGTAPKDT